ncbi:MAG: putative zinc-binding protein [Planctomycetota bacterium]|nr:putative zinc-binding protein [Planctomycetota bacterium]
MAECCGKNKAKAPGESCGCEKKETVLLYACSGGANVAEVADQAARQLTSQGSGSMFCLAGIGAGIPGMIQTARDADVNLVIDGCPMDCGKKVFDKAGLTNYVQIKVTDLGIEKVKVARATEEQVATVVAKAKDVLAAGR